MHIGGDNASRDIAAASEQPRVFRVPRLYCLQLLAGVLFAVVGGTTSVITAYRNADGSFPDPVQHAIGHAILWGAMAAFFLWGTVALMRDKLVLDSSALTHRGIVRNRKIPYREISRLTWPSQSTRHCVVVRAASTKLSLELRVYTSEERTAIVDILRSAVPTIVQEGWDAFLEAQARPFEPPPKSRTKAALCMVIFAAMSAVFFVSAEMNLGKEWHLAGVGCAFAAIWYAWRIRRFTPQQTFGATDRKI